MKRIFFIFLPLLFVGCKKDYIDVVIENNISTIKSNKSEVTINTVTVNNMDPTIVSLSAYHVSPMTHYKNNGQEYILLSPHNETESPIIQLKKVDGIWSYLKNYPEAGMGVARNYEFTKEGLVYSDHGIEPPDKPWPLGKLHYGKFENDNIKWTSVTVGSGRSFYHSVSTGDLNGDGLTDLVGIHMGIKNHDWGDPIHVFIQNTNGTFSEDRKMIYFDDHNTYNSNGSILVVDLYGDKRPEIVRSEYGSREAWGERRYGFIIYEYNDKTNRYEKKFELGKMGVFANPDRGSTSIKSSDFNKDGKMDLAIAVEGGDERNLIQIFLNDGKNKFIPMDVLDYSFHEMQFREFDLIDYDEDGDMDIILRPFHYGNLFRVTREKGVKLNNLIWRNDVIKFSKLKTDITFPEIEVDYLKPFLISGVFKFIGIKSKGKNSFDVVEIIPKFYE